MITNSLKRLITIAALVALTLTMGAGLACAGDGIDQENGTVKDSYTGLIWLKDANCFGTKSWGDAASSVAGLHSDMCGLTDKSKSGQWRLPTRYELSIRFGRTSGFVNIQSGFYWTSEQPDYWPNHYYAGSQSSGSSFYEKSTLFSVWPVRNAQ
ncbi:MAG: DUF1566 domain-containing protein [Deltaproteobacteria bacterium]|nr:DUF1566 domain-containing protein [Deltaproteobacteria bacterium]